MPDDVTVSLVVDGRTSFEVSSFQIEEALHKVSDYRLSIRDAGSDIKSLIGKPCKIQFAQEVYRDAKPREFAGLIMSVARQVGAEGSSALDLVVAPALGVLALSKGNAVYENKTALDILKAILARNGLQKITIKGSKPSVKRPVVIQYNENDLEFCRRILAEEGITFFFSDGSSPEALVLHDTSKPFPKSPKQIKLTDAEMSDVSLLEAESLTLERSLVAEKVELRTYDPSTANTSSASKAIASDAKTPEKPEILEYRPVTVPQGRASGAALDVLEASARASEFGLRGTCQHPAMHLGQEVDIASDGHKEIRGTYVITGIFYQPDRGNAVSCRFDAVPKGTVPAPPRLSKPEISGVHGAKVIGPSSAKAGQPYCDAEGRVHVRFFWDTEGKNTVWLRVAEPFAGRGYGAQFIPRVGQEVLVSFLGGDPDAPVITGQVYTSKNKPPYGAKNGTKSGIRTKLEGPQNEIEFDDKKGAEMLALRAGKDFNLIVAENALRDIKKLATTKIGETCDLKIGKDFKTSVTGAATYSSKSRQTDVENTDVLKAKDITLQASSSLTLKVGSSSIKITSSGITLSSTSIKAEGKGSVKVASKGSLALEGMSANLKAKTSLNAQGMMVNVKGQVQAKLIGPMAEVSGSGMLTLKGGVCMIN